MSNQPVYWKMRNGKLISVDDMDNNHVRNAFKMLLRNLQKLESQNKPAKSFQLNGDIANDFNDMQTCPHCGELENSLECCGLYNPISY